MIRVLIIVLTLIPACAKSTEYRVKDLSHPQKRAACLDLLGAILSGAENHPSMDADFDLAVSTITDLERMLSDLVTKKDDADAIAVLFNQLRKIKKGSLAGLAKELNNHQRNSRLFFCLLGKHAELPNGAAGYYDAVFNNFELFDKNEHLSIQALPRSLPRSIERVMNTIVTLVPSDYSGSYRAIAFMGTLVHEYQHFLDHDLLTQWIRANRRLINQGKEPDLLFKKHVRIFKPGKPGEIVMLSKGFFYAFLESRAYYLQSALFRRYLLPQKFLQLDEELKSKAIDEIESRDGKDIMAEYGLNEKTLYRKGLTWKKQMEQTIKSADQKK